MKQAKKRQIKKQQSGAHVAVNILKGTVPDFDDPVKYYVTLFSVIGFWGVIAWKISLITLLIPGASKIFEYLRTGCP